MSHKESPGKFVKSKNNFEFFPNPKKNPSIHIKDRKTKLFIVN